MEQNGWDWIFLSLLTMVSYIDIRKKRIPDLFSIVIIMLGVIEWGFGVHPAFFSRLAGMFIGISLLSIISFFYPGAFGGGDIKLLAAGGFYLGVKKVWIAFVLSILISGAYCIIRMGMIKTGKIKKERKEISVGPFLCIGFMSAIWFGEKIWQWYIR